MSNLLNALQEYDEENETQLPKSTLRQALEDYDEENQSVDSIDKMNENLRIQEGLAKLKKIEMEKAEEPTFASETFRALLGGGRDAAQGVLNLGDNIRDKLLQVVPLKFGDDDDKLEFSDFVPTIKTDKEIQQDIDEDDALFVLPEVEKNETIAGQIARDLTRFVAGMVLARKIRMKTPAKGFKDTKILKGDKAKTVATKSIKKITNMGLNVVDGVLGSQLVSSGDDGRLSDVLAEIPQLTDIPEVNEALDYLKTNPKDSEGQARLKMAIEDAVVAFPLEIGFKAAKMLFKGSKDPLRKSMGDKLVNQTEDAINAEKTSAQTLDLLSDTGSSKALLPDPLFDQHKLKTANITIKFRTTPKDKTKPGVDLFETETDGVEQLITSMVNDPKTMKKLAKITGTKASHAETIARAEKLGLTEDNFKEFFKRAGMASTPEYVTAARLLLLASVEKVIDISNLIAKGQGGEQIQGQLAKSIIRFRAIQEKVLGLKANAGRTLNALSIPVGNNPAIRSSQINALNEAITGSTTKDITKLARDIVANTDDAINKLIKKKFTNTKTDLLNQYLYFSYLSSPSTYGINFLGNLGTQVYETVIATPTAALVGAIKSPFTKNVKNKVYLQEAYARFEGAALSSLTALKNFGKVLRDGDLPPELKRMSRSEYEDFVGVVGSTEGAGLGRRVVSGVVRLPGKVLLATDALFKTLGKGSFVYQHAYRGAIKKGLTGEAKAKYIKNMVNKPTAQLEKAALEDAARVTFTQDNIVASKVAKVKRIPVLGNITAMYLPFIRTPINLAKYGIDNSIFGIVMPGVRRAIKAGGAEADEAIGRMAAGTSVMALSTYLASQGVLTGTGDGYQKDLVKNQGLGWQEKSLFFNGKYYDINRFDPFATLIGFGADFHDIYKRLSQIQNMDKYAEMEKYLSVAGSMIVSSTWANLADKAMLTGISKIAKDVNLFSKAIESGNTSYEYITTALLKQVGRAVVPNIIRMYGRTSDPFIRDTYTFTETVKDAFPFLRDDIPIRYNMFGQMMYLDEYSGEGFANDVKEIIGSMFRESRVKDDAFAKELVKMEYVHSRPLRKLTIAGTDGTSVELDAKQYAILEGTAGRHFHQLGHQLINSRAYIKALPYEKKKMIKEIRQVSNAFAKEMVLQLHGKELYEKANLNYFERRRETVWWEYLPDHLLKGYINQMELKKKVN